ncbi:MAG: hypothetical protein ACTSRZ_14415 [Promethearchaeota archaeon]
MDIIDENKIYTIFVDREDLIQKLKKKFSIISKTNADDRAYCILNAPGTGKTTLVQKFGEIVQKGYTDPYDPNNKVSGIFVSIKLADTTDYKEELSKEIALTASHSLINYSQIHKDQISERLKNIL